MTVTELVQTLSYTVVRYRPVFKLPVRYQTGPARVLTRPVDIYKQIEAAPVQLYLYTALLAPCIMPGFYVCVTCKASLPIKDKHGRCSSCLGPDHAKEALANRSFCDFCAPFSKHTLEKRLSHSSTERSASLAPAQRSSHQHLLERWLHPHPRALRQERVDNAPGKVAQTEDCPQGLLHPPLLLLLLPQGRRVAVPSNRQTTQRKWKSTGQMFPTKELFLQNYCGNIQCRLPHLSPGGFLG
ncbi:UNVERIFIED_CONTAM: hypothetical protein FKN15_049444 [Acipenser sinensis]